jgi:hypothetical protein
MNPRPNHTHEPGGSVPVAVHLALTIYIVPVLIFLSLISSLAAQEKPPLQANTVEELGVRALRSAEAVAFNAVERMKLQNAAGAPNRTQRSKDATRLKELNAEEENSLEATRKVTAILRVGESVSSYPGLLALGRVEYLEETHTYAPHLIEGYGRYEDSQRRFPTYCELSFDLTGRITGKRTVRTADMVTQ